jgi:hypothetical protein
MRMVQHALDPRQDRESWKPRDIKIDARQRLTLTQLDSRRAVERTGTLLQRCIIRVRNTLRWSHHETPPEARVWDLLERIARPPAKDAVIVDKLKELRPGIGGSVEENNSWRPTVWFNPWMYQTGEQTWAGLANEIINQIGDRMDPIDREWFWLQLNLRRLNRESLRRRVHAAIFQRLIPGAIVAGTVLLLAVVTWVAAAVSRSSRAELAAYLMPLSPLGFLIWGGFQVFAGLRRRVASSFPDLVEGPKAAARVGDLAKKGAEGLGEAFEDPGYAAKMGFLYLIQTDMRRVLDLIATKDQPLVVFVDDLDRCSPGTVSQVIEAVNLFLAGEFPNCIFVLAMEPDIVAAHVEVQYDKLVTRLGSGLLADEWTTLGWRFLDKIVQLPLSIPEPDDRDRLKPFLDGVLGQVDASGRAPATAVPQRSASTTVRPGSPTDSSATVVPTPPPTQRGNDRQNAPTTVPDQSTLATPATPDDMTPPKSSSLDVVVVALYVEAIKKQKIGLSIAGIRNAARAAQAAVSGVSADAALSREAVAAARQVFEELLSEKNPDVRHAIESGIDLLGPRNPRQVKRFINLFRFYAFIEGVRTFSAADNARAEDLTAVAKVAAMAIRWPSLVSALTRKSNGHHILDVLEAGAAEGADWPAALRTTGLLGSAAALAKDADASLPAARRFDDLRHLLASGPKTAALGRRLL